MSRSKRREQEPLFDPELADLPEGARRREWLGRVEAAIFASPTPVAREALAPRRALFRELYGRLRETFAATR